MGENSSIHQMLTEHILLLSSEGTDNTSERKREKSYLHEAFILVRNRHIEYCRYAKNVVFSMVKSIVKRNEAGKRGRELRDWSGWELKIEKLGKVSLRK